MLARQWQRRQVLELPSAEYQSGGDVEAKFHDSSHSVNYLAIKRVRPNGIPRGRGL